MNEQLQHKRHTLAHLMAAAVQKIYPDALLTIGPAVDNGFYYDIAFAESITDADLKGIEKQMKKTLNSWKEMTGRVVTEKEARDLFKDNKYKLELIDDIVSAGDDISLYSAGAEGNVFTDLCRGGHLESPSTEIDAKAFCLASLAGAYWRGDENNDQLTRIYGYAFDTREQLDAYKTQLAEAKKRDHRILGKELELFTFSELVGPGLPLWLPKGTLLRDLITQKITALQAQFGYQSVTIPHITKKDLYETSGHWEKFGDELFKVKGQSDQQFVMKPMNCPHHTQIFAAQPHSYKDLPIRYAETTMVYRDEQAGELLGLSRVRSISQDDGHVFCAEDDIKQEILNIVEVIRNFYTALDLFGDNNYWVSVSVRDKAKPETYLGNPGQWDIAERILEEIAVEQNFNFTRIEGEAAFYGPKLDFMFKDAIGREWQLATAQLDFVMPERFGLEFTNADGEKETPVMIHRAVAGSLERFLSVIIEHFAGAFPVWLSPVQAVILPVSDKFIDYAKSVQVSLRAAGIRVDLDDSSETLGKRIRLAQKAKTPYMLVVGEKEVTDKTIAVRARSQDDSVTMSTDDFIADLESL